MTEHRHQDDRERRQNWFTAMTHYLRSKQMKEQLGEKGPFKHITTPRGDNPIKAVEHAPDRFDQLSSEDRWSKTEFKEKEAVVSITVQDPNDTDDIVLPTITAYPMGPTKQITVEDGDVEVERPREKISNLKLKEE